MYYARIVLHQFNTQVCTVINDVKTMRRIDSSYHSANVKRSILLNE